jgi:segregation and condensation protein B
MIDRAGDDAERSDEAPIPDLDIDTPDPNLGIRAGDDAEQGSDVGAPPACGGEERRLFDVATAPELEDDELGAVLEALAAATEQPAYRVAAKLRVMADVLTERDSGIDLREAGGGWRMYTRAQFAPYVERLLLDGSRSKLTRAALETLAVVAYRQPVTRARVSAVRGVNVDAVMRTLLARGLITEAGTDPDTGAVTFATTELFLERLGLSSLTDLPDIAPLLPDVDMIDDLSESLDAEPRFVKLSGGPVPDDQPLAFDVDQE